MSKKSIVYWAPVSFPKLQGRFALLGLKPVPLINDLVKRKNENSSAEELYQSCTAFREGFKNTYYIKYPITTKIDVNVDGTVNKRSIDTPWFIDRKSSFSNSYALDLDLGIIFFSEDPMIASFTPPYMHKTKTSEYGFIMSGSFDISSWFRPYMFTHQLWPDINNFETIEGDAAVYISFNIDNDIEFKQFILTEKLFDYSTACVNYKFIKKFVPFKELYEKFKFGNLNKMVLKEIKENLVENEKN